jgi:hypothetical protein
MNAEQHILCLAARTTLDRETELQLCALLERGCDWERLWAQAHLHDVAPLVTSTLRTVRERAPVPADWLARGERRLVATLVRNRALRDELLAVVGALRDRGVESICVKGVVLAETVYGSLALRPASDLDLLVRPVDLPAARPVLRERGYGHREQLLYAEAHHPYHDPQYFRPIAGTEVCLELHRALWHPRYFAWDEAIWERACTTRVGDGAVVGVLSPEDTLLHLAIHRTRSPLRLRLVSDVAELLRAHPELDWDQLVSRAEAAGARTAVFAALVVARDLLDARAPSDVLARLRPGPVKRRVIARTCGPAALFRPAASDDLEQQPSLALRAIEQDGAARIARTIAAAVPRKVHRLAWERSPAPRSA